MKKLSRLIIVVLFLPFVLLLDIIKSERSIIRKIGYLLLVFIIFTLIWLNALSEVKGLITYNLFQTGISDKLTPVRISGTSMLPTIKDGEEVTLGNPKKYGLERGDIVSFSNEGTNNLFYIKRIIGTSGEQISIKNGYYYINGNALEENYILNQLPTFGNTFLPDCESANIPHDYFFVSGDNRTVSFDSRAIGFIHKDDIEGVIKTNTTEKFVSSPTQVKLLETDINPEIFLEKLNGKRVENQVSQIVTHETLNNLAKSRAQQIKDNFSAWKNKTIPIDKLLEENKYGYNLVREFVTFGYLDEQAIVDQIFDSPIEKDQFLSSQFTEVGIGIEEREYQECKYPIISIILSWPVVATYDQEVLDAWAQEIDVNNQSLLNLQNLVGSPIANQSKLRQLISIVAQLQQIAERIYNKQINGVWLTQKDYNDIKIYDDLTEQAMLLDEELLGDGNVKGASTWEEKVRRF
jgi:signal peptidase I